MLEAYLRNIPGFPGGPISTSHVGGGSINKTFRLQAGHEVFFLKVNEASRYPGLFEKEKQGLELLATSQCIRVPRVVFCNEYKNIQLLVLEWIETGSKTRSFWENLGRQLASLHRQTRSQFGFITDNYMGALPQQNILTSKWTDFFIDRRIRPQVDLAVSKKRLDKKHVDLFQQVCKKLDTIFNPELPSLLHGDLWSGNYMCDEHSAPVLIDPAVYYGHRSMDLAMTTLFGGFDPLFYDSYHYHFPLPENYKEQWEICNLYPLLIHLNLFGESYLAEIVNVLKKFGNASV